MHTKLPPLHHTISDDMFLGGKLRIYQPLQGYRAGIEAVLLGASLPTITNAAMTVLDVGCGVGVASCCLAWHRENAHITGIEIIPFFKRLADENARRNQFNHRFHVIEADIAQTKHFGYFDYVITNPPFSAKSCSVSSPFFLKAVAHNASSIDLNGWILFCLRHLKPNGVLTAIADTQQFEPLIASLQDKAGGIEIFPLWPKKGRKAKRILLRAYKNSKSPFCIYPGMVLHEENGTYTSVAEGILRFGHPLPFDSQ